MSEFFLVYHTQLGDGRSYVKKMVFLNKEDHAQWDSYIRTIKHGSDYINALADAHVPESELVLYVNQWLGFCREFIIIWGPNKVPLDIRLAINEYEEHFGKPKTSFGSDDNCLVGHNISFTDLK